MAQMSFCFFRCSSQGREGRVMLLHRDEITVKGPYQLCASIFVQLELRRSPGESKDLEGVITLCDASGKPQGVMSTQPFECTAFCLVVARLLPFNLGAPPRVMSVLRDNIAPWEGRSMKDRSLIYLHSVHDHMRTNGYRIPFFNFLLRILEHTSNLRLTFEVTDTGLSGVEVSFGTASDCALVVQGRSFGDVSVLQRSFIPLSEGLVKT